MDGAEQKETLVFNADGCCSPSALRLDSTRSWLVGPSVGWCKSVKKKKCTLASTTGICALVCVRVRVCAVPE